MATVIGLQCIRCSSIYPPDHYAQDCPACKPFGSSNLTVMYDATVRTPRERPKADAERGMWRYGDVLPVRRAEAVSLGEGGSILHRLGRVGEDLGVPKIFAKDETRNPTWSFKDRLACMAVSCAKQMGAETIVSSSSGNAGAATAAYAAKAGLRCVVFTFKGAAGPMLTQMRAYGATVVVLNSRADRWTIMQHAVYNLGWYPASPFFGPAVGSNPYGIEGYKTLAYEIVEQLDWRVPEICVLPVCYGDALVGMWRGFEDMVAFGWTDRMPRMVAAEVYGSLGAALHQGTDAPPDMPKLYDTVAVSIGATRGTFQALDVIRRSGGLAITIPNEDTMRWQQALATMEGLYVEPSSAAGLAAIEQLVRTNSLRGDETVVSLLTAGGLKDPNATAQVQGELPTMPEDMTSVVAALKAAKIFPQTAGLAK